MIRLFILGTLMLVLSCRTASGGKEVKQDTKDKRDLPILHSASNETAKLNLRTTDFFDYTENGELYAGMYSIEGSTLNLAFQNNHHPEDLTNKGSIDVSKKQIVLFAKETAKNRVLNYQ